MQPVETQSITVNGMDIDPAIIVDPREDDPCPFCKLGQVQPAPWEWVECDRCAGTGLAVNTVWSPGERDRAEFSLSLKTCAICPGRWPASQEHHVVCTCCQMDGWSADGTKYRGWIVEHNPPPVPTRAWDWQAHHEEYDGPGDNRWAVGASRAEVVAQIDEYIREDRAVAAGGAA